MIKFIVNMCEFVVENGGHHGDNQLQVSVGMQCGSCDDREIVRIVNLKFDW